MKRMLAFLLCAVLLISCLPLTAMAAKSDTAQTSAASVEQKFRLLLEDLELVAENPDYEYFYEELGQYPAKDPEWILISGGLLQQADPRQYRKPAVQAGLRRIRRQIRRVL